MTMALPFAFVACTSDEFETTQNGPVDLSGRKALGDVELIFSDGAANTRLEIGQGGIGFSTVDGVGACLVDQPNGAEDEDAIKNYTLTNFISSNYLYKTADAGKTWTTDARMVEGNYVFYAPHNEAHLTRASIAAEFPNPQIIKMKDGAPDQYSAIQQLIDTKAPMYVGYNFLDSKTQTKSIAVAMKPIYSYPKITLKNMFGTSDKVTSATKDLTIRRIVISNTSTYDQKTTLEIGDATVASNTVNGIVGNLFNYGGDADKYGTWVSSAKLFGCKSSDILAVAKDGTTGAITLDFETPYVLAKDKSISINAVVPAGVNSAEVTIGVYTNEGYFEKKIAANKLTLIPGQMYPREEYTLGGDLSDTAKGSNLTVEMTAAKEGETGEIVSTTEELINLASSKMDLVVMPLNANVTYNAAVAKAMLQGASIKFTAPVTVEGVTVTNKLVFDGDVTVKGNVEFKQKDINWSKKMVVKAGAALKVTDYDVASTGAVSPEEGATVELAKKDTQAPNFDAEAEGLIKVNESATFPTTFTKYAGTIEIAANKTMTLSANLATTGEITNNGTLAMGNCNLTNGGTFANVGKIEAGTGKIENKGTFTNKNTINAAFENQGAYVAATKKYAAATLKVEAGAIMFKVVSNSNSRVESGGDVALANIIELDKDAIFNGNTGAITNGTASYTIESNVTKAEDIPTLPAICNTLVIKGNIVPNANLDIDFAEKIETNNIYALNGTVTFTAAKNVIANGELRASKAVTFTAAADAKIGSINTTANVVFVAATTGTVELGAVKVEGAGSLLKFTALASKVILNDDIALTNGGGVEFTAGATEMTVAKNCALNGGKMEFKVASEIKVAAGATFTIADGATVTGATGPIAVTFTSLEEANKTRGQVVNNGTVQWAAQAYASNNPSYGAGWWTNIAAHIDGSSN